MARICTEPFSRALVVEGPHAALDGYLLEAGMAAVRLDAVPDEDALIAEIHRTDAQVLFKRSRVPVTRRIVEACPGLYAVQLCSIGTDSVDLDACAEHGVMVFNDPVSNGRSVVELAIGHILALARRLYETDVAMNLHQWEKTAKGRFEVLGNAGEQGFVSGKRLGVFRGELGDLARIEFGIRPHQQGAAVCKWRKRRRIARQDLVAEIRQLEVAFDLRQQQADHVGGGRATVARCKFFGNAGAADQAATLQHQDLASRPGQVSRADQAVMTRADDDDVGARHVPNLRSWVCWDRP